jgi:hypothetical protein
MEVTGCDTKPESLSLLQVFSHLEMFLVALHCTQMEKMQFVCCQLVCAAINSRYDKSFV